MSVRLLTGDCRDVVRTLPDASVQCCVTSPPYWGLRDYGTATWVGGRDDCTHRAAATGSTQNKGNNAREGTPFLRVCGLCDAVREDRQLGLERTPDEYVARMVEVFREVRRVLRNDGTLWLNLGDSYTGSGKGGDPDEGKQATNKGSQTIGTLYGKTGETARQAAVTNVSRRLCAEQGLAPKNLVGIPWRVAFALQADGWYLRSEIIWHKPNPMPESVTDRPTKAHEQIFLLAKSERYFYDADAIREPDVGADHARNILHLPEPSGGLLPPHRGIRRAEGRNGEGRNARSVWMIPTSPYSGAHFATFPPKLIEPCVLAGSRKGDCVLDPFGGAGTTGLVADRLGRDAILIELNPAYAALGANRIADDAPLFADVTVDGAA